MLDKAGLPQDQQNNNMRETASAAPAAQPDQFTVEVSQVTCQRMSALKTIIHEKFMEGRIRHSQLTGKRLVYRLWNNRNKPAPFNR